MVSIERHDINFIIFAVIAMLFFGAPTFISSTVLMRTRMITRNRMRGLPDKVIRGALDEKDCSLTDYRNNH